MKIHKQGKETAWGYIGFGRYQEVPSALCEGAQGLYRGRKFQLHSNWKYVTCKKCLAKK